MNLRDKLRNISLPAHPLNCLGWLLLGLSLGLADELMWWNWQAFCYQFPYISGLGCLDQSHSWEVNFAMILASAALISIRTRKKENRGSEPTIPS
jgi:hypothetical protein